MSKLTGQAGRLRLADRTLEPQPAPNCVHSGAALNPLNPDCQIKFKSYFTVFLTRPELFGLV